MPTQERSGLIVPVVLWGRKKLKNRICVVAPINNGQLIVTGSLDGQVIQWAVDERNAVIRPHMMMIAHESAITCISGTSLGVNSTRYVTCSLDGQVCLWDSVDGRAVDSIRNSYSYRVSSHQIQTRLFCIGDYAEIIVMDSQDLNIIFSLSSRVEPDWISAMTIVHPPDKPDVVIGVSISGMIKLWSLKEIDKKDHSSMIYEDESKIMNVRNVQTISCSNLNTRMMLVISPTSWQIADPSNLNQLIVSECSIEAIHGVIIDIDKVAIAFVDSTIVLFQLPRSKLTGKQVIEKFGDHPKNVGNIEHPFVFALLKGVPTTPLTPLSSAVSFYFDTRLIDGHLRRVAYRADHQGKVDIWLIPRKFDPLVDEFLRSKPPRPVIYEPVCKQSFEDMWPRLSPPPPSIADLEDKLKTTATAYLGNQGKLLLGREDGSIVMMYACHAIMSQLLDWTSTDPISHRILLGHSAAVTCFLYPFEGSPRYDPHLLLSGGMDFTVIVWNIVTGSRVYRFCCQGGPILKMLVPPDNCTPWVLHTVCSIASDNSAALLSLKENKCVLLASRHMFPIVDVKWRPLDDLMLVRCEDESVYVWQMDTANLDRIVTGLHGEDVIDACKEQIGLMDVEDEAGASQAVQMLRALKNKNVAAIKKLAHVDDKSTSGAKDLTPTILPSPMDVIQLKKCSDQAHLVLFNVDALIMGLLSIDYEITSGSSNPHSTDNTPDVKQNLANLVAKKTETLANGHQPNQVTHKALANWSANTPTSSASENSRTDTPLAQRWHSESNIYMDTARLLISLIHAWNLDENLDIICSKKLKLHKPKVPLSYGLISRRGHISLYLPKVPGKELNSDEMTYYFFSKNMHWQLSNALSTIHLVSGISLANVLMSLKNRSMHLAHRKSTLRRVPSNKSSESAQESESHQIKQGWSNVAALHCVLLPDLVKPSTSYMSPKIELLARRWQDNCIEIRDASQALLIRELSRLGVSGRKILIDTWAPFLPTLLDPNLSIFGHRSYSGAPNIPSAIQPSSFMVANNPQQNATDGTSGPPRPPPPRPAPPLPPRPQGGGHPPLPEPAQTGEKQQESQFLNNIEGEHIGGVRRNQATAIILLGVMGAEFLNEMHSMADLARATAHSLLELLISPETPLLPLNSPLRRAAIDLIGRGFVVWQPHLDISKVLLGLLDLASSDKHIPQHGDNFGAPLSPEVDACRTARHALSLIASARPQALITALSMEVARFNAAAQHQTIQHAVVSPLLKSRIEVLRLIEQLSEKQYNDVADLIIPVGDILVHCVDTSLLKTRTLAEIFPPIAKFYMVGYCPTTRRIAFGGKNGAIVIHELKASKAQNISAHKAPITALAFSQDGKYLASYSANEAKLSFWQSQQTFLGMGQSQIRCVKTLDAPAEFPVLSPGGSYQSFRARLVWINSKSLTLMLPNGKENRFTV